MSNGTRPAVLLHDLLSGDGPHHDLADRFVAGRCVLCGAEVGDVGREGADGGLCDECSTATVDGDQHSARDTPDVPHVR